MTRQARRRALREATKLVAQVERALLDGPAKKPPISPLTDWISVHYPPAPRLLVKRKRPKKRRKKS